jgi:hypothetical protein
VVELLRRSSHRQAGRQGRCFLLGWAAVWVGVLVALSGCKACSSRAADERPALGKIVVKRTATATVRGTPIVLDHARLASKAKDVLESSGVFAASGAVVGKRPRANVAIALDVLVASDSDDAQVGIRVRLKIDVHPSTGAAARYAEDTAAVGQAPLDDTPTSALVAAFERLAERSTEDLLRGYVSRQKLWTVDEAQLARALSSEDTEVRLEAVRIAGVRKLKGQLPTLIGLLSDKDEATRDAALGAVVAMGDRSAVKALADSRQMRDSYEMSKLVDAVATLGGQEAKDYLSFVAATHDDPDIRKMAQAALDRLKMHESWVSPTR